MNRREIQDAWRYAGATAWHHRNGMWNDPEVEACTTWLDRWAPLFICRIVDFVGELVRMTIMDAMSIVCAVKGHDYEIEEDERRVRASCRRCGKSSVRYW